MADMSDKKSSSGTIAAMLGTLMLGFVAARGGGAVDGPKPTSPGTTATVESIGRGGDGAPSATLAPLQEVLIGKPLDPRMGDAEGLDELKARRARNSGDSGLKIRCLVALVPDPVNSSVSFRFDETLNSIERAAVAHQFVLERWRFPWELRPAAGKGFEIRVRWGERGSAGGMPAAGPAGPVPVPGEPGLLVFRKVLKDSDAGKTAEFLAIFLVPETPTHGVDRPALVRSLGLSEGIRRVVSAGDDATSRAMRIVGPSYSGSMPSLRDGLKQWWVEGSRKKATLDVVAGAASAFDKEEFVRSLASADLSVGFSATVHKTTTTLDAIIDHFASRGSLRANEEIVILTELNTAMGQRVDYHPKNQPGLKVLNLRYPLNIGDIRRVYESQGLLRGGGAGSLRAALEIHQQAEDSGKVRDILPDQTPSQAAMAENRTLGQTLKYLDDGQFRKIGIISTDPHDAIFLARLINRYCPDATIFVLGADLSLMDPEVIADMRGVLVGSTYPLFPLNQVWTESDDSSRGTTFPSQHSQAFYNASVIQLDRILSDDLEIRKHPGQALLEYATPPVLTADRLSVGLPPIWISKVGERALYPVDCIGNQGENGYLCPSPPGRELPRSDPIKVDRFAGWMASLGSLLAAIVALQLYRPHPAASENPKGDAEIAFRHNRHFAAMSVALMTVLSFASLPLFVVEIEREGRIQTPVKFAVIATFAIVLVLSARRGLKIAWLGREAGAPRWPRAWAELGGVSLAAAYLGAMAWMSDTPARLLLPVRATALTGGVSGLLPLFFLLIAIGAWAWASHRFERMGRPTGPIAPEAEDLRATEAGPGTPARVAEHRAKFDALFDPPPDRPKARPGGRAPGVGSGRGDRLRGWWESRKSSSLVVAAWAGVVLDSLVLRRLSNTGEGRAFDLICYGTAMVLLLWIGLDAVRLARAWKELKVALGESARTIGPALGRIPSRTSSWYLNPEEARGDASTLILRQVGHIRGLIGRCSGSKPSDRGGQDGLDLRLDLDLIEFYARQPARGADRPGQVIGALKGKHPGFDKLPAARKGELGAVRHMAQALAPTWAARPVARIHREDPAAPAQDGLVAAVEDLLALEAARWIGGALARIWTLAGSLVVGSLALLLAVTSYPFPEQSRAMTLIGLAIGALAVLVLRIAIGTNRDEALNLLADHDTSRIRWDATLLGNLATYVVPLVGVLAALSFETADLFRSVLGPILRLLP